MPEVRPPRFPRDSKILARQGEALAKAIQRLAPGHRDLVARIVQALEPAQPAPPEPEGAAARSDPPAPPDEPRH